MAITKVTNAVIKDGTVTSTNLAMGVAASQDNVAVLGFKIASADSLAIYGMKDGFVDDYQDATGVDASASTNATRNASNYYSGSTSAQEALTTVESSSWTAPAAIESTMHLLVVAGGGSGGTAGWTPGAGGGGGLVYISNYAVTGGQAYTYTVGAGGAGITFNNAAQVAGNVGADSVFDGASYHQTITANGGGGGGSYSPAATAGGSGGGGANSSGTAGASNQPADFGSYTGVGFGNAGGAGYTPGYGASGGGGGAGGAGEAQQFPTRSGNGGAGKDMSAVFGTDVGDSGWFAGGGGGAGYGSTAGSQGFGNGGSGNKGGGGDGSTYNAHDAEDGTANTGGGAGGARNDVDSKAGGSGVIILKYNTLGDMTVVSTSQTALTTPADVRMVALMTPSVGTITLNTDFKGYVSRDGGTTYTQVTLVDEGTSVGTTKIVAGTADISSQPSGTSMVYKIESLNQSGSKQLNLNGTSLSWQ